jgi:uncharacterized protein YdhG (YjbR/CyaY superfamily)
MEPKATAPQTVDDYIALYPKKVQAILKKIRATIKKTAPETQEAIKYLIPTCFTPHGNLLSFAAYATHIGVYPAPSGSAKFNKALAPYRSGKSTAKFPLDKPIPYDLIAEIVKLRMNDQLARAAAKKKNK